MKLEHLTVNDALVLKTVSHINIFNDEATGVEVWRTLTDCVGRIAKATVYSTLYVLTNGGLLKVKTTKPVKVRGGRRRQVYSLTATGKKMLNKTKFTMGR